MGVHYSGISQNDNDDNDNNDKLTILIYQSSLSSRILTILQIDFVS